MDLDASVPSVAAAYLKGHNGAVHVVRFTADGKYCLTGGSDRTIRLWNPIRADPAMTSSVGERDRRYALPIQRYDTLHSYPISSLAVDGSSRKLVSSSEKTLVLSDVVTGQLIRKIYGHEGRINSVACTEDASLFVSGSYDATARIWDGRCRSHVPIQVLDNARDSVSVVSVGEEKKEILTASVDGRVRTYDVRNGRLSEDTLTDSVTGISLSNDGLCIAASCLDGNIHLLEKYTGSLLKRYKAQHKAGNYALECRITSNDAIVVSGSENGNIVLYDLVKGTLVRTLTAHAKPTCSVDVHPKRESCSVILSAGYDGYAIVWASKQEAEGWER